MTGGSLVWLGATMGVFLSASAALRAYVGGTGWGMLGGALLLYSLGNLMMVRLMRESGMAIAISVSAVLLFAERPMPLQWAGIVLGVVAVALIVWPTAR